MKTDQQSVRLQDKKKEIVREIEGNTLGKLRCHVDLWFIYNYVQAERTRFLRFTDGEKKKRKKKYRIK